MRFNCDRFGDWIWKKVTEREKYITNWHPFFCLLPCRIAPNDCRWLEYIERRKVLHNGYMCPDFYITEYRAATEVTD